MCSSKVIKLVSIFHIKKVLKLYEVKVISLPSQKTEHSLKFNKSTCESPLIATNNSASFYDEVEGCGLQCMNPFFNQTEHDEIHAFIAGWASAACLCTLFAMVSLFNVNLVKVIKYLSKKFLQLLDAKALSRRG